MFSTFRLVLAPQSHLFLDYQIWGRWERKTYLLLGASVIGSRAMRWQRSYNTTLDTAQCTNIVVIAINYRHLSYGALLTTVRCDVLEANVVSIRP